MVQLWIQDFPRGRQLQRGCANLLLAPANEVWGKVIFLHLFVILFTGGGGLSASVHAGIPPPPGADTPGAKHAGRYGQRADGTHPTGMQSCLSIFFAENYIKIKEVRARILPLHLGSGRNYFA